MVKLFQFHKHDLKKGIGLVLIAWLCFSSMWMVSKLLHGHTTVPTMLFFRNVFGMLVVLPWIIKYLPKSLKINNPKILFLRSAGGFLNLVFILIAVQKISLINTTLLNNTAPFFVPFIVWFWLKIPINHRLWPAILIGFIGIALILQPDVQIFNFGAIFGLLSGIFLAFTLITMRLATKSESFPTFLFYFFAFGLVCSLPFAFFSWKIENFTTLLGLLGIGFFSTAGQFFLFFALKYAKASHLAPFGYVSVIYAGIYEWLIWNQTPVPIALLGALLIVTAGIWVVIVNKPQREKLK